jgi:putative oxidoreductase
MKEGPFWKKLLGPYAAWAFRVALGAIFIVASIDKIADPLSFAKSIANYHLVPESLINLMALVMANLEFVCGIFLILGILPRASLVWVNGLLIIFIIAIISALSRQLDIGCGCFDAGSQAQAMTRWTLYWDLIWLAMGVHSFIFDSEILSVQRWLRRRSSQH